MNKIKMDDRRVILYKGVWTTSSLLFLSKQVVIKGKNWCLIIFFNSNEWYMLIITESNIVVIINLKFVHNYTQKPAFELIMFIEFKNNSWEFPSIIIFTHKNVDTGVEIFCRRCCICYLSFKMAPYRFFKATKLLRKSILITLCILTY